MGLGFRVFLVILIFFLAGAFLGSFGDWGVSVSRVLLPSGMEKRASYCATLHCLRPEWVKGYFCWVYSYQIKVLWDDGFWQNWLPGFKYTLSSKVIGRPRPSLTWLYWLPEKMDSDLSSLLTSDHWKYWVDYEDHSMNGSGGVCSTFRSDACYQQILNI